MNIKKLIVIFCLALILSIIVIANIPSSNEGTISNSDNTPTIKATPKKVLYVASYNIKNPWSSGIKSGIKSILDPIKNIELKTFNMDTLGENSEEKLSKAALAAKDIIDTWKPDIVITSDDNAAKYLIVPYYQNSELPFVFCGVNWDASKYGFPSKNVTGMVEVQLVNQLAKYLSPYAKGDRIGSIRGNTMTNHVETEHFEKQLGKNITTYFADNINEWKEKFLKLQNEVDMILIGDIDTVDLNGESKSSIEKFIFENTKIPTGHWDSWFKKNALITLATIPKEQGEYAAETAVKILGGRSPSDIPLVTNKEATVFLNMKLAKKLNIVFPMNIIADAQLVGSE